MFCAFIRLFRAHSINLCNMRTFLLSLVIAINCLLSNAQCVTTASNFGNNITSGYDVSGDVSVTLNANHTVALNLGANFTTAAGPDVRAYLVNSNGMTDTELQSAEIADLIHIEFGLVSCTGCVPVIPANGAKTFTVAIPNGEDIRDYDTVFFYCLRFNAFWDFGSYTPFSNSNCNSLSIGTRNLHASLHIHPNPTRDFVSIDNTLQIPLATTIYDVLGKKVLETKHSSSQNVKLNLSSLKAGIYLLQVASQGSVNTTRLIKQ